MMPRLIAILTLFGACMSAHALPPLVFVAPTNHAMPLARIDNGELQEGILKDLGALIAARLGREARFVVIPSLRVGPALAAGRADGVCYVRPNWIEGQFHWTRPFIDNDNSIVSRTDVPPVRHLKDLADVRVATVLGYQYPDVEAVLGKHFYRSDGATTAIALSKLAAGRTGYAITEQLTLAWYLREHPQARLRADLAFTRFKAQCAFSLKSSVSIAEVDKAIDAILADGSYDAMLARYR